MKKNKSDNKIMKVFLDILKLTSSNIFVLIAGILSGFIIPKIMGVSNYGYYKAFGLYISYSSLFRLGIVDGIYLMFGGKKYEELDKKKFRAYSQIMIILETIFSLILILISLLFIPGEYKYVFLFVSIYIWAFNVTSYYQIISQVTSRFAEMSSRNIIQAILSSSSIIIFWLLYKFADLVISYKMYTLVYVAIQIGLSIWYIFTYKDITFGERNSFKSEKRNIILFIKSGMPLLIANLCSTFLLTLDRQFVNILFENNTYAIYAFAYNLLSLVTVATSAISTVIYPTLKRLNIDDVKKYYDKFIMFILFFVFGMLIVYFPLSKFIIYFLPKYKDSLDIFKVIFPGLAISSAITVVMHNYYKILNSNFEYFFKSVIALVISFVTNLIAYLIFKTPISISIASIFTMFLWYFIVESKFIINYKVKYKKNMIYMISLMVIFYVVSIIPNIFIATIVYVICFLLFTIFVYGNDLKNIYKILKKDI